MFELGATLGETEEGQVGEVTGRFVIKGWGVSIFSWYHIFAETVEAVLQSPCMKPVKLIDLALKTSRFLGGLYA